jgi:acyl carrier protein
MDELISELKQKIIDALNLGELTPEELDADSNLFGDDLGLDSIDALEIILLLEKHYGIRLSSPSEGKAIFKTVRTLAEYVASHRTK